MNIEATGKIVGLEQVGIGSGAIKVTAEVAGLMDEEGSRVVHLHWFTDLEPPAYGSYVHVSVNVDTGVKIEGGVISAVTQKGQTG